MALLFWISFAGILYTYAGYPVGIWALGRLASRRVSRQPIVPRVSVVVPCYNEESNIEARIKNIEASDYPSDKLEIIVVSDGSTDRTIEAATKAGSPRTRVVAYPERRGKAAALNYAIREAGGLSEDSAPAGQAWQSRENQEPPLERHGIPAHGRAEPHGAEVVVFADARQRFEPQAIRELVANLADETVGAVTGELILAEKGQSQLGDAQALYWNYEKWIRKSESRFDSSIGATGAIYAIRRELWRPLPEPTILDDVYTPMQIAMKGYRVVFEEKARGYDEGASTGRQEFMRKTRTLTGNYQLCQLMPRLLVPTYRLAIQFYSHKLMRLIAPLLLALCFASNAWISIGPGARVRSILYDGSLIAQTAFYLLVAAGWILSGQPRGVRLAKAAYAFSLMNVAALVGLLYFITGKRDVWTRKE